MLHFPLIISYMATKDAIDKTIKMSSMATNIAIAMMFLPFVAK